MGLTVSNQAANLYQQYALQSSDAYKNNALDSSAVSKEAYNVSNLEGALDALAGTDQVDLYSVGTADSYAKGLYTLSQLSEYDSLTSGSSALELLNGSSTDSLNEMYGLIAPDQEETSEFLQGVIEQAEADATVQTDAAVESYKQYLNTGGTGNLLDASL